ncbi:hypothetical protein CC86DRAFT_172494 [Ophiobolus disseminans]|uniref:Uncharacterized protein n=1 Tax=Ophiobolus disseminans TaxID=1469910 RepID=A0A6A7A8L2_9PLEO|nr:hypothetical protein CC86DRAFT_172494 [Ophiobolus disseminans]
MVSILCERLTVACLHRWQELELLRCYVNNGLCQGLPTWHVINAGTAAASSTPISRLRSAEPLRCVAQAASITSDDRNCLRKSPWIHPVKDGKSSRTCWLGGGRMNSDSAAWAAFGRFCAKRVADAYRLCLGSVSLVRAECPRRAWGNTGTLRRGSAKSLWEKYPGRRRAQASCIGDVAR